MKQKSHLLRVFLGFSLVAALLAIGSSQALALGLGRVTVQSSLGEPLRAEIEITSISAEEAAAFRANVARPDVFRAAGVDYSSMLAGTEVSLQRRPDGQPYLRLTSTRPVVEPFVDVILELSWSSGRLVREYTMLFDPPTLRQAAPAPQPTAPAVASAAPKTADMAPAPTPTPTPSPAPLSTTPAPPAVAAVPVPTVPTPATPAAAPAAPSPTPAAAPAPAPAPVETAAAPAPVLTPVPPTEAKTSTAAAPSVPEPTLDEAVSPTPMPEPIATRPPEATREATPESTPESTTSADTAPAQPESGVGGAEEYRVKQGDTLYRVASNTVRPGVSLDQMLVALYRFNPQAFLGENMNRLKAGAVLTLPSPGEADTIAPSEARRVIQAHSADFSAYRQRLAQAAQAAKVGEATRQASGKVEGAAEDRKQAGAPSGDKLTLSKGAVAGGAVPAPEDQIAKAREKAQASTRVAELSKNVEDLNKIASASAPAPAAATAAASAPPAAATTPGIKVPAVAPPPAAVPAAPAPAVKAPAPAAAPTVAKAASEPAPAAPAVTKPAATPAPAAAPAPTAPPKRTVAALPAPAPAPEPSFLEELMDNPLVLPVAAGVVVLLAGLGIYRRMRRRGGHASGSETSFLESRLQPDSFFGASGGQRIDTKDASGASSSLSYSLSQLDAIGDVDPVAEADVYLAYGRDLQAEEILKEAMRSNPDRLAIRTKLLEIYAKRRDIKGFELLATQLHAVTGGRGEDWARAQELGQQLDPENTLYQPGGQPATPQRTGRADMLSASTMPLGGAPSTSSSYTGQETQPMNVDLDLDFIAPAPAPVPAPAPITSPAPLTTTTAARPAAAPAQPKAAPPAAAEDLSQGLMLDLPDLGAPPAAAPAKAPAKAPAEPALEFDLGGLSLDLNSGGGAAVTQKPAATPSVATDDPLATKLALAEEFRHIGDVDGAKELLQEVLAKASGAVKAKAQQMLSELG